MNTRSVVIFAILAVLGIAAITSLIVPSIPQVQAGRFDPPNCFDNKGYDHKEPTHYCGKVP